MPTDVSAALVTINFIKDWDLIKENKTAVYKYSFPYYWQPRAVLSN